MMTTETQEVAGERLPVVTDDTNPVLNTPEATAADGVVEEKQDEPVAKTFTQAEVDALIQKRLVKEARRQARSAEQLAQERVLHNVPQREAFRDDDAYMQAHVDHLAEVRAAEKIAQREQAQKAERMQEAFLEKAEKASERYADFQTVVSNPSLNINGEMAEFITDSDVGAEIAYFLGKNPMKAYEIASLSPVKAARELTRIEAEIASKPKATPSKAPDPITPVGSRGKPSSSSLPSDDDDMETWARKERERMRKR